MKIVMGVTFFLIFVVAMFALPHWAIYKAIINFWDIKSASMVWYLKYAFIGLSFSFIFMTLVTMFSYSRLGSWVYSATAVWQGTVWWLFLASVLGFVALWFVSWMGKLPGTFLFGQVVLVLALFVSLYGVLHSMKTVVTDYTVELPNLPTEWQGKKIVMFADTHFGAVRNVGFAKKVKQLIEQQNPYAILISGDFYDGPPANYSELAKIFGEIKTEKGIYFANGNHEEFRSRQIYDSALEAAGIVVLDDRIIEIDGLQIAGVNYSTTNNVTDNSKVIGQLNLDSNKPSILIKHVPNALEAAESAGFDLQVSGHTHSGQVWPGPLLTKYLFKGFSYGKNMFKNMQVITTSGVGTWGPPQRVSTNSEIVVITLGKK